MAAEGKFTSHTLNAFLHYCPFVIFYHVLLQACGENTQKKSDNYGKMRSRLKRNYTLGMKISLESIIPYHA